MEINNFKSDIPSSNRAIKVEYNKLQKPSNFFRGEKINNNKQPKKLSYDQNDKFIGSRIKENEIEPRLLLEKLPPAFNFKNNQNSNDSKTTTQTKLSINDYPNHYNKLNLKLNISKDFSPNYKNEINIKKKSEERKKINNYFIKEEINLQNKLKIKKNNTDNILNKHNNDIIPLKTMEKSNNDYFDKKSSTEYNKNFMVYYNKYNDNNYHLKTDLSEYENLKPKNNLLDIGYNPIKDSTFNIKSDERMKNSIQISKQNNYNINNKKIINYIFNEEINMSDLYKKSYRKKSDLDIYPSKFNYIDNTMKKNERSGSYIDLNKYQNVIKSHLYYSPNNTNSNINNKPNTNDSNNINNIKKNYELRLSAKPLLHPIIPHRKKSQENERTNTSNDNNIKDIKTKSKMPKMAIIIDNYNNKNNLNLNINKKDIKQNLNNKIKKIENINEGITYKYNNGYKYYFNLRYINIYFLKEVQFNLAKGVSTSINIWNKNFYENNNYLSVICRILNTPENHYTFVIEYPKGGESLYDIINSIGLNEPKQIYYIISEIIKNISLLKKKEIKEYQNIPFCLCDLFLTINEELKIMPPVIRKIPINSSKIANKLKKETNTALTCNICQCKKNYEILLNQINLPKNNISFFCLGSSILQIITQNLLFKLKSYNTLIKNNNKECFHCCLIHSLLNIEKNIKNNFNGELLLLDFLKMYDDKLIFFIHSCTKFEEIKEVPNCDFIDYHYRMEKRIDLSIKELFKIIYLNNNNYISLDNFLKNFKLLFNDMKIDKKNFISLLHENKIIDIIKRNFNIDKKQLKNNFMKIIYNNEFDEINDDLYISDKNENYANSGNCFYNDSSFKQIENNNKKMKTINETINNENKRSNYNNKNNIIFKNYIPNNNNN